MTEPRTAKKIRVTLTQVWERDWDAEDIVDSYTALDQIDYPDADFAGWPPATPEDVLLVDRIDIENANADDLDSLGYTMTESGYTTAKWELLDEDDNVMSDPELAREDSQ